MVVAFCGWVGSSKARRLTPRRDAATSASRMTRSLKTNISMSIEWRAAATAARAAARIPSPGWVTSTCTCRSGAGGGMGVGSPASARSCRNTRSRLSTTGPAARTSTSWFSAEWLPQLMPPTMARTPSTIRSFTWSIVKRSSGNATTRTRRAGPYTDRYYYGFVYLSMLEVGPAHRGVGGIIQRPCDEDISRCRGTRARPPRHAGRPSSDPQGERAGWHHRRRRRFRRRLSHQTGPGKEPLLRHDRTGGPVRRGLGRLYPGKPRSLIRRGLLAVGAGVPLLALVTG